MRDKLKVLGLCAALLLSACKPEPAPVAVPAPAAQAQPAMPAAAESRKDAIPGGREMTALNAVLEVFSSSAGTDWKAYDAVPGVRWNETTATETPEVSDASLRYSRSGRLLLSGFGDTELPDGKVGADAGVRQGNEGESGLTLNGDEQRVNEVAIVKFYPSIDYAEILKRQFPAGATIALEADRCEFDFGTQEENTQKNAFFRVEWNGAAVHAEVYVDEEGGPTGPGSTTFVFYRSKPEQRIAAMKCREG